MAKTCDCTQCKIRRAIYGADVTNISNETKIDAVQSMALVLGAALAEFEDAWLPEILTSVLRARNEATEFVLRAAKMGDLASTPVAGHG